MHLIRLEQAVPALDTPPRHGRHGASTGRTSRSGACPMLAWLVTFALAIVSLCMPAGAAASDRLGVHGMVLFGGKDGLYASHLPMFHQPHDVQVVLRVRFTDPGLDSAIRARLEGRTALWTLEPERFALQRLAPGAPHPLEQFSANVVEGHFEQGGAQRYLGARLAVEQVVLFRPLDPAPSTATVSRYLPVGRFMVKLIDSRPDFDHIVLLKNPVRDAISVARTGTDENLPLLDARAPAVGTVYYCADDLR